MVDPNLLDRFPLDRFDYIRHHGMPDPERPAGAYFMGLLDRLFGKPSVASFAEQMIQAFRQAGDKTDMRFDASENESVHGWRDESQPEPDRLGNPRKEARRPRD